MQISLFDHYINHYKAEEQCTSLTDRATFKLLFVARKPRKQIK